MSSTAPLSASTPVLQTKRLLLMPLQLEDASALHASFAQWEVVRYLTHFVPWPYPAGEMLRYLKEDALPAMQDEEEWHWTIRLRNEPEQIIGAACLMDEDDNNRGFWLAPAYQGQGLMSEACKVMNRFWFQTLMRNTMRVAKAAVNQASCRISLAEGMRRVSSSEQPFVCGLLEEQIWELTREQWLSTNAPESDQAT